MQKKNIIFLVGISFVFLWSGYDPVYPEDWMIENILTVLFLIFYGFCPTLKNLSIPSQIFLFFFLTLHIIGSKYAYSNMPLFEYFQGIFDLERNHYDRVVHFSFGFLLSIPIYEFLIMKEKTTPSYFQKLFAINLIVSLSALFELIEWQAAEILAPELGGAYLGMQGDIWDAQKDMALAMLGSVLSIALLYLYETFFSKRSGKI